MNKFPPNLFACSCRKPEFVSGTYTAANLSFKKFSVLLWLLQVLHDMGILTLFRQNTQKFKIKISKVKENCVVCLLFHIVLHNIIQEIMQKSGYKGCWSKTMDKIQIFTYLSPSVLSLEDRISENRHNFRDCHLLQRETDRIS